MEDGSNEEDDGDDGDFLVCVCSVFCIHVQFYPVICIVKATKYRMSQFFNVNCVKVKKNFINRNQLNIIIIITIIIVDTIFILVIYFFTVLYNNFKNVLNCFFVFSTM